MTTLCPAPIRRTAGVVAIALALITSLTGVAFASPTTSAPVSVEVVDIGTLEVRIGSGDIAFLTESGGAPGITTESGATAYASVPIVITDTRSDTTRRGYSIVLSMGAMTQGPASISSAHLSVVGVTDLPAGMDPGFSGATSLASSVPVVQAASLPPSGTHTIYVDLALHIPAGTVPGSFSGNISLDIVPADTAG